MRHKTDFVSFRTRDEKPHFSSILGKTFEQPENGMGCQGETELPLTGAEAEAHNESLRGSGTSEEE